LQLLEQGQDGTPHATSRDCEVWGKKAAAVGELESGQLTLCAGKLARRNRGAAWELVVRGSDAIPVLTPPATLTGSAT
jgi:hypothetical protein